MALTDLKCKNAKPTAKAQKLADGHGLYLEITPTGGRYWRLKYRYLGKEKRLALGVYPEVSLAEARDKREAARKLLADEIDPGEARKVQKRKRISDADCTFERVARDWHDRHKARWSDSHAQNQIYRMEQDIFPVIGHRPIGLITTPELLEALRKIEDRGAHEMARRARQCCDQVFRHACISGLAENNPATNLRGALKPFKKGHFAAIDSQDLPDFLKAVERNDLRLYPLTRLALKLLLLTFVRTSELIEATWDEFDLDGSVWLIPAERMKMRRPHLVPLSDQALTVLRELKALSNGQSYIFPSQIKPKGHMSNNTILKVMEKAGYKGRMTGHGVRALAMSTIKEKLGYRHEVVDRQLAHAHRNAVDAAYDRAQFLDDRKKMMQDWADYLDGVAS